MLCNSYVSSEIHHWLSCGSGSHVYLRISNLSDSSLLLFISATDRLWTGLGCFPVAIPSLLLLLLLLLLMPSCLDSHSQTPALLAFCAVHTTLLQQSAWAVELWVGGKEGCLLQIDLTPSSHHKAPQYQAILRPSILCVLFVGICLCISLLSVSV